MAITGIISVFEDIIPHYRQNINSIIGSFFFIIAGSLVWATSNRAVNLVNNNLKGIFFRDHDFEHMAFSVVNIFGVKVYRVVNYFVVNTGKLFRCQW